MKNYYLYNYDEYQIVQTPNLWDTHQNYNYILKKNDEAIIFDPGEYKAIAKTIKELNLNIKGIFLTHHHQDHVGATKEFSQEWKCPVYGYHADKDRLPSLTDTFDVKSQIPILGLNIEILFLPGHTHGLCAFYIRNKNWLFSNDLIFSFGCGRVFEGTYEQMFNSLLQVTCLPDETVLFSSHEYTHANIKFALSILKDDTNLAQQLLTAQNKLKQQIPTVPTQLGFEKANNPFLSWRSSELRTALKMKDSTDLEVFSRLRKLKDHSK